MRELEVKGLLEKAEVEAVLVTDPYNMRYLSGFSGGEGALLLTDRKKVLITDSRYTEAAGRETDFLVLEESRSNPRGKLLAQLAEEYRVSRMGFEDASVTYQEYEKLRKTLPEQELIPLGGLLDSLRAVKTEEELKLIRRAESIGDLAFAKILEVLKPGISELEVAAELEYQMKRAGAEGLSFDTIVASGLHSSMPHAVPTEKKLEPGDFVTMDFGCRYQGYCSDMTRTVVIGKASQEQKKIYQTVLEAQRLALDQLSAGKTGRQVDAVARGHIAEAGYGKYFGHGLGHSLGLFIHEEPRLSPGDDTLLLPGMVETVEPGIYVPGFGGVRIEDLALVKEGGCENYTGSPKELIEL
ncbi:MAG TPA: aminopeptidase P family protein [Candidatus Egerieimonas intestinavium]|uniref:Aminopeptidase P family protein n=1 Tax=Candidatus Egerieimonas intestinavium TaxID=2840777 RepID=A0A9D1EJ84_9FIRM|nr:aminopeptidase P family protein [Candidatus Egerieimonas intestinavium]